MDENSVFDRRFPCHDCDKEPTCSKPCLDWHIWVETTWPKVCKPFRDLKKERDAKNG